MKRKPRFLSPPEESPEQKRGARQRTDPTQTSQKRTATSIRGFSLQEGIRLDRLIVKLQLLSRQSDCLADLQPLSHETDLEKESSTTYLLNEFCSTSRRLETVVVVKRPLKHDKDAKAAVIFAID